MPTLPIPMIGSLFLALLLLNVLIRQRHFGFLAALLGLCALQGFIISSAQHYELAAFHKLQPITASIIPPLAWISFQTSAIREGEWRRDALHLLVPLFVVFCLLVAPRALDVFIPSIFAIYGFLILYALTKETDALPEIRLGSGDLPRQIWRYIAFALVASAISDGLIVAAQTTGYSALQPWIISIFSTCTLLIVGSLSLSQSIARSDDNLLPDDEAKLPLYDQQFDEEIMHRLNGLVIARKLYLDPELTLNKLARRLHIPVKQLSIAINRSTGENVSRYINKQRIIIASDALLAGENVTSAMLMSGFNTKSNFNREFLRINGIPPTAWLRDSQRIKKPNSLGGNADLT